MSPNDNLQLRMRAISTSVLRSQSAALKRQLRRPQLRWLGATYDYARGKFGGSRRKTTVALVAVAAVVMGLSVGSFVLYAQHRAHTGAMSVAQPTFSVLLPYGKKSYLHQITNEAGGTVVAYPDKFNDATLTVRQQLLPLAEAQNPALLAQAAAALGAEKTLSINRGTLYLATDAQQGTQTAILTADQKLIFIRSDMRLDDESWQTYVNALRP